MDDNPYRAGFAQLVVVADTDAEAERIYLKHLRNFYSKSLYVAPHFGNVPGFMTKRSFEFQLSHRGASAFSFDFKPHEATWKQLVEDSRMVIGGSPDTVAAQIEEAVRNIRVGHLMIILQIQSMDPELTAYSSGLFAEKVLPKIKGIWDKEGYGDRWWPQGATRNQPQLARSAAKVGNGEAKVTGMNIADSAKYRAAGRLRGQSGDHQGRGRARRLSSRSLRAGVGRIPRRPRGTSPRVCACARRRGRDRGSRAARWASGSGSLLRRSVRPSRTRAASI